MRRGLTLLELLLAVALVIALGAIALPAMLETSEHKKLSQTAEEIEQQLMQARAHAMVMGAPVELRFDRETRRMVACDVVAARDERRTFDRDVREEGVRQREDLPIVKRSWAQLAIDQSITIATEPPEFVALAQEGDVSPEMSSIAALRLRASADDAMVDHDDQPVITLALFLPDGSAPIVEPIWLSTEDGRAMRIDIGRWTGLPTVVRDPRLQTTPTEQVEDEPADEPSADDANSDAEDTTPNATDESADDSSDEPSADEGGAEDDEDDESGGVP